MNQWLQTFEQLSKSRLLKELLSFEINTWAVVLTKKRPEAKYQQHIIELDLMC